MLAGVSGTTLKKKSRQGLPDEINVTDEFSVKPLGGSDDALKLESITSRKGSPVGLSGGSSETSGEASPIFVEIGSSEACGGASLISGGPRRRLSMVRGLLEVAFGNGYIYVIPLICLARRIVLINRRISTE